MSEEEKIYEEKEREEKNEDIGNYQDVENYGDFDEESSEPLYEGESDSDIDEKDVNIPKEFSQVNIGENLHIDVSGNYKCLIRSMMGNPIFLSKDQIKLNNNITIFLVPINKNKYKIDCYLSSELNKLFYDSSAIVDGGDENNFPIFKLPNTSIFIEGNYFLLTRYTAFILLAPKIEFNNNRVYEIQPISKKQFFSNSSATLLNVNDNSRIYLEKEDFVPGYFPRYKTFLLKYKASYFAEKEDTWATNCKF